MQWQIQDAKAKLSQLVKNIDKQGPQVITVHGEEKAVLLSKQDYDKLLQRKESSFLETLQKSPFKGLDIDFSRDDSENREIDL